MAKFQNNRKKNSNKNKAKKQKKKEFSIQSCETCPNTGKCRFVFNYPGCNSIRKKIDKETIAA